MPECPNAPGKICNSGWSFKSWTPRDWLILIVGIAGLFGITRTNVKVDAVESIQERHGEKQDEVKQALDERSVKVDKQIGTLQKTADKTNTVVEEATGPQLFLAWKQLEQLSFDEPSQENVQKAKEAKEAYDKFRKSKLPSP